MSVPTTEQTMMIGASDSINRQSALVRHVTALADQEPAGNIIDPKCRQLGMHREGEAYWGAVRHHKCTSESIDDFCWSGLTILHRDDRPTCSKTRNLIDDCSADLVVRRFFFHSPYRFTKQTETISSKASTVSDQIYSFFAPVSYIRAKS